VQKQVAQSAAQAAKNLLTYFYSLEFKVRVLIKSFFIEFVIVFILGSGRI
jgi:hypothetical protein